ncbi:hypothetical protein QQG74_02170 [Micromonospora sp. FIMYZ51]|uniref:hypothetical protein n=1 Tax=Micromonospora sp. FIMYZ51 TaxID=3051832 RepID=UPI00311DDE2B
MPLSGSGEPPAAQPLPVSFPVPDPALPMPRRRGPDVERVAVDDRQLVFFGAETGEPAVTDLAGLLAGPGEVHRMGGTARLSVVVDAGWRVHVLVAELAQRGVRVTWAPTEDNRYAVRTAYARTLVPLAAAWLRGATQHPPAGLHLDGRRLRLWLAAAGVADPPDFLLYLGGTDPVRWTVVGGALIAAGLIGELVEPDAGGPAYRITGRRGTQRLAELVGDRPSAAPPAAWPTRD